MILFICILALSGVAFFVAYNYLSASFRTSQKLLHADHQKLVDQVSRLDSEKRELAAELAELEKQFTLLKHDIKPTAHLASKILVNEDESSKDERMGDFMVSQGMITLEQHEKAMKRAAQLKMDFAATCQALGFIDQQTATAVKKQIQK